MMRRAGRFNAQVMDFIRAQVRPGITTGQLDDLVFKFTTDHGHVCTQRGYKVGEETYHKSTCISVNEVVCHGIPGKYALREGDIVNIDVTTTVDGWIGDSSETFMVGEVSDKARGVVQTAFDSMWAAIDALTPGCRVAMIGKTIVDLARKRGYSVVQDFVGHGVGRKFHQEPSIPHYPTPESYRARLLPGMTFTVEPMINVGSRHTVVDPRDGWTVRSKDGSLSAQFEHTVLMTEHGPEPLTITQHGPQKGHRF
jgi:methionyl aminopeptidase